MSQNAADFLMGGGGPPAAKFPSIGTGVSGRITEEPTLAQQRDFSTGEPKFWNDGNPQMQLVVTLATEQRDPAVDDDDGRRRIFVKGQMKKAIQDAVLKAGGNGLEVGARLSVYFVREGERKGNLNPPKEYRAEYVTAVAAEFQAGTPAAPAYQQGAPVSVSQAAAAVPAPLTPENMTAEQRALFAQFTAQQAAAQPAVAPF